VNRHGGLRERDHGGIRRRSAWPIMRVFSWFRVAMDKGRANSFPVLILCVVLFLLPGQLRSEIYKYVNDKGEVCFVDHISKVPLRYRDSVEVSGGSPAPEGDVSERKQRLEEESRLWEKRRIEAIRELETLRGEKTGERPSEGVETKVTVFGNQVLVPAKLGYGGDEIEALLILDTGASATVLYREVADKLRIKPSKWGRAQVGDGRVIRTGVAKVGYLQVGEARKTDFEVCIVDHRGPQVKHGGLLGMDFLRSFHYAIDFERQVILWKK